MSEGGAQQSKEARSGLAAARPLLAELAFLAAPRIFAFFAAASGVALLFALAAPQATGRLRSGDELLAVIETSHFLASLAATLLILLSFGLAQRMRTAWGAGVFVFLLLALLSFLAGRHAGFAAVFVVMGALLFSARRAFYRAGRLATASLSPEPLILIALALAGVAWLGFFAYDNVEYSDDLWWTFAADADASRFLRALVISVVTLVVFALWRLMQPGRAPHSSTRTPDMEADIAAAVASAHNTRPDAALAFLPDKRFVFSEDSRAFVMFGVRGRNWIAMGPPVGPADAARAAAFAFKRAADDARANAIFYAATVDFLPLALDLGLSAQKVGETAIIDLPEFSLEGSHRARLRQSVSRLKRAGVIFEVLYGEGVAREIDALEKVSTSWLRLHRGTEKAFTLGRFDRAYMQRSPVAVLRLEGAICAFANVWISGDGKACAIDLMRHAPDAPQGAMDGLMIEIALWARERGMQTFDLGMAPLSGMAAEREADALSRLGALVYSYGETLYGFEGLRQFKDKFRPRWEPVYLAGPTRVSLATALADVALLTSGGLRGMLKTG